VKDFLKMDPKTPVPNSLEVEGGGILCTPSPCDSNAVGGVAASPAAYGAAYGADDLGRAGCCRLHDGGKVGTSEARVLSLATEVCDHNIQLTSHVETLRARVLELEDENARLKRVDSVPVGVEKMVELLQADIAGTQRELELLKVAKRAVDEDLAGEREKNLMLTEMLEAIGK
jgi:hypothetical protein